MRKRGHRRSPSHPQYRWQRVRGRVQCALGDACFITAPAWAYFGKWHEGRQFIACEKHLREQYPTLLQVSPPPATFTATHDGEDVKAAQLGEVD